MGTDVTQSDRPRKVDPPRRTGKTKTKSGCQTCKVRKVKCDESRPACYRCVSTGRVCNGYGIWGGGGNFYGQRQHHDSGKDATATPIIRQPPANPYTLVSTAEERRYLEWFRHRTVKKIPGLFVLAFWNTLLFQASAVEPSVRNAVLTLSSVQSRDVYDGSGRSESGDGPDEQEKFTLKHYNVAIRQLQRHISAGDKASVRVALITCAVFIYLELLRGHFRTALAHLESGIKVLGWLHSPCDTAENNRTKLLAPSYDPADVWITEVFSRIHLQVELFRHTYHHPYITIRDLRDDPLPLVFASTYQAWEQLQKIFAEVFHLTEESNQRLQVFSGSRDLPRGLWSALLARQQHTREQLARWEDTYEASKTSMEGHTALLCSQMLELWHTTASIMIDACLRQDDESVFDTLTDRFVSLVTQCVEIRNAKLRVSDFPARHLPGHYVDMARSVVDVGWIPPLYYTAIKCRIHRVRLQAFILLASGSHREGLWDSKVAACVARKVIEIEEGDFYKSLGVADNFSSFSLPEPCDLSLPVLPQAHRMREVKVVLPDDLTDGIWISYLRGETGGEWESTRVSIQSHFDSLLV